MDGAKSSYFVCICIQQDGSLTHQHFVEQIVSAGGFNVHDVQAPEAAHKVNMHLPSARVRHLSTNETQASMLKYM